LPTSSVIPIPASGWVRAGGGDQGQRGGLPGQTFPGARRQLGFGPIDRLLPNQSRVEIGCLLDSLAANHRRTTSSADHPFETSGSSRTRTCKWFSLTAIHDHKSADPRGEALDERRPAVFNPRLTVFKTHAAQNARRTQQKCFLSNALRSYPRVDFKPLSSRILPQWRSITTLVMPSDAPT
jgi:hypothetical protein